MKNVRLIILLFAFIFIYQFGNSDNSHVGDRPSETIDELLSDLKKDNEYKKEIVPVVFHEIASNILMPLDFTPYGQAGRSYNKGGVAFIKHGNGFMELAFDVSKNKRGDGNFVYLFMPVIVAKDGIILGTLSTTPIWLVIDTKAYPLNGPSKKITPSLPWPRETEEGVWDKTGLDKYSPAIEAFKILNIKQ